MLSKDSLVFKNEFCSGTTTKRNKMARRKQADGTKTR